MESILVVSNKENEECSRNNPNKILIPKQHERSDMEIETSGWIRDEKSKDNSLVAEYYEDCRLVIEYSIPSILTLFSLNGIIFINALFIDMKNDSTSLAAWGLGFVTLNIASISFADGIADGMDSLVAQTYGKKDYNSCEVYLNLWRWWVLILSIPQLLVFINLESILLYFEQPENVARETWLFWIWSFPGVVFLNLFEWNRRYLSCWEVINPGTVISIVSITLQFLLLLLSSFYLEFGVLEVGISTGISWSSSFFMLEVYNWTRDNNFYNWKWKMISANMIELLPSFLDYAFPCLIILILFWWPQEMLVIYSGWIGVHELAVMAVLDSLLLFITDVFMSIGLAAVALIGNSLGANNPDKAKRFASNIK